MRAKITVGLFSAAASLFFTPVLWNYFQNERLRVLLSSSKVAPTGIYTRFAARMDAPDQLAFWATSIAVVLGAFLCLRRYSRA